MKPDAAPAIDPDPALVRQDGLERWAGEGIQKGQGKLDLGLGWDSIVGVEGRARVGYGLTDNLTAGLEAFAKNPLDGTGWETGALGTLTLRF